MPTFYSPHPGFAGAAIPIPLEVRQVAKKLNGKKMSLRKAVKKIQAVTFGRVEAFPREKYIGLYIEYAAALHFFRVIRYR